MRPRHECSIILDRCCLTRFRDGLAIGSRWHFARRFERSAKESVCSGNSAFTVGAAAMTAAGAVAASTRRKGRTSKAGTSGRGLQRFGHRIDQLSQVCEL